MRPYLLARLYLAKDSPRVELFDLLELLNKAPYLPQTEQLSKLAAKRGAQILPDQASTRKLVWTGGSPQRCTLAAVKNDPAADIMREQVKERIVANDPGRRGSPVQPATWKPASRRKGAPSCCTGSAGAIM